MYDSPYVRDTLTIDATVQSFYDQFRADDTVFLLGRYVRHDSGYILKLKKRRLVIVADTYDVNGGAIQADGTLKDGYRAPVAGTNGVDGPNATLIRVGHTNTYRPVSAGKPGTPGTDGTSGFPGTDVTILCRNVIGTIRINNAATPSAPGGNGGKGGLGGGGTADTIDADGNEVQGFPGTRGGKGGKGGNGGDGAGGGAITIVSTSAIPQPSLVTGGTPGSAGGRGGRWGQDGFNTPVSEQEGNDPPPTQAPNGIHGTDGANPAPVIQVLSESEFVNRMLALLNSDPYGRPFANYWAPFRVSAGEYYFRKFQPGDPQNSNGQLAAREFVAALEMQPDNAEALRLLKCLQSGGNALGLPRYQDVVPDFNRYITSYNSIAGLVTSFFNQGIGEILAASQLDALARLLQIQKQIAQDAVATITSDVNQIEEEQKGNVDQVTTLQQQLDETTSEIQKSLEAMKTQSFSITGFLGTVAQVGAAVASVVAAIPTAGASIAALVPAVLVLTSTVVEEAPFITKAVLAGQEPDLRDVDKAYKEVGKNVEAVVTAGKTVVNFVHMIEAITAGSTPENAESVALIKRGAELAHQILVAKATVDLTQQKLGATQARLSRSQAILDYIQSAPAIDSDSIRTAGQLTISAALLQVDTLLTFAFMAQRSFEIYTLPETPQLPPRLDAGSAHPDTIRAYQDGLPGSEGQMVASYQAAWNNVLNPINLQRAYAEYLQRDIQAEVLRLSFSTESDATLIDGLRTTGTLPFHVALDSISQGRKETKIRGVAVALVGANSPSSVISCSVWHGTRYEQVGPAAEKAPGYPNGKPVSQLLNAKSKNLQVSTTPLVLAPVSFGEDEPIDAPQQLPYWGRGVAGDWEIRLPEQQPGGEVIDLSGMHTVQVWIGYQYVPNPAG